MTADLTPRISRPAAHHFPSEARLRAVGEELIAALRVLLKSIPGASASPTRLGARLGLSRVIASRMLGSLARDDALESMRRIPGPESLRVAATGAAAAGADVAAVARAIAAIEGFAVLIREEYGTRGLLHAALAELEPSLRAPVEAANRAQIHRSVRDLLGISAEAWVMTAMLAPSRSREGELELARVDGALGIERISRHANVHVRSSAGEARSSLAADIGLREGGPNAAAASESITLGAITIRRLESERATEEARTDLLAASHERIDPTRRASEARGRLRLTTCPDIPVRELLIDVLLHDTLVADMAVRAFGHGRRSLDAMFEHEPAPTTRLTDPTMVAERLRADESSTEWTPWPQQRGLIRRLAARLGHESERFVNHRMRLTHPLPGFRLDVTVSNDLASA